MSKYGLYLFILLFSVSSGTLVFSQNRTGKELYKISGKVINSVDDSPLEYATITLLTSTDSTGVTGIVTNTKGAYQLEAPAGNYLLRITFLGFEEQYIDNIALSAENPLFKVPDVQLAEKTQTLDEVEITAEKSRMEFALDKKIFNVGKDLANNGGSASDLLDNIPSVTVDIEGEVSLRGSNGVRLLINGKPSSFVGNNSADALKQLPANMIEKVEIITNPSARYEAEGSTGIINIVLKKERRQGWNGSFDVTGGYPQSHRANISLNHRREKFNFFTNLGVRYRWTPRFSNENREIYNGSDTTFMDQVSESWRGGISGNIRLGADYSFNEYNTLTASVLYRKGLDGNQGSIEYLTYDALKKLADVVIRNTVEDENEHSFDYSLNYEKKFEQKGRKFTADIIYNSGWETEAMDAYEEEYDANYNLLGTPNLEQRIRNGELESELTLKTDYEHPIGKDGKFEAGYRGGIRNIDNNYKVEEYNRELSSWEILENISNDFEYDEQIHAAYLIYGNKFKKFSYQGGLRAEATDISTYLKTTGEPNEKKYANLFPSVFMNYEINAGNAIQLSYSRRIRRPRFWDLNPFFSYSNPLSIRSGNPDLDPEFANSFEIGHIKYWEKASLSSSLYYRHTTDVITHVTTVDENGVNLSMPQNLNTRDDIGAEFSLNLNPTKSWDITWSGNIYRGQINGENLSFLRQTTFFSYTSRLNSKITLPGDWDVQIMVNYRGPERTPQGKRYQTLYTDAGISKDILKQKATISFRMTDLFNTSWYRYEAFGDNFYIYREGQWRTRRQGYLTFSYRLNQKKRMRRQRDFDDFGGDDGGE